jgi:hypothetical protein
MAKWQDAPAMQGDAPAWAAAPAMDDGRAARIKAQEARDRELYKPTGSFVENALAGVGKSIVDTGRGLKQLAQMAGNKVGLVDDSTLAATQADIDESKRLDAPLMSTGGGLVGNIAGQVGQAIIPGGAIAKAAPVAGLAARAAAIPRVGGLIAPAAGGAAFAGIQPVASDESRATNMALGAAGGAAGKVAANALAKGAQAVGNAVAPEVRALASRANELGIPLRLDQLTNSKPVNALAAAVEYVPLSGAGKAREVQMGAFRRAVARTMGESTDNLSTAITQAERRLGNEFDDVLRSTPVRVDDELLENIVRVQAEAASTMTDAQAGVIRKQIDNILSKVGDGEVIEGQAAYNIKKLLDRLGNSNDTTLAYSARELRDGLLGALNRSLGDEGAAKFATTRKQWQNMRELQKMVQAGAEGEISPARLAQARPRLRTDDLRELSDIAGQFLKGRVGDSGTAQRALAYGAIPATVVDPATALTTAGIGLTAGRATNATLNSRFLQHLMLNGSPGLQRAIPPVNALAPGLGAVSALEMGR